VSARNLATDILRGRTVRHEGSSGEIERIEDTTPSAERGLLAQQDIDLILKILSELPEKCRQAFILYKFDELGYPEIARSMGVSESMIRKHVLRAVAYCAMRLDQLEGWS